MATKLWILFTVSFVLLSFAKSQNKKADSTAVAATLQTLVDICKNVDFGNPQTTKDGSFYKAAPYIIYRGTDEKRNWKSFANYKDAEEKKRVDEVCFRINQMLNQEGGYTIEKYFTEKESEGVWQVLTVNYKKKGIAKQAAFAFLKVNGKIGLGDID